MKTFGAKLIYIKTKSAGKWTLEARDFRESCNNHKDTTLLETLVGLLSITQQDATNPETDVPNVQVDFLWTKKWLRNWTSAGIVKWACPTLRMCTQEAVHSSTIHRFGADVCCRHSVLYILGTCPICQSASSLQYFTSKLRRVECWGQPTSLCRWFLRPAWSCTTLWSLVKNLPLLPDLLFKLFSVSSWATEAVKNTPDWHTTGV